MKGILKYWKWIATALVGGALAFCLFGCIGSNRELTQDQKEKVAAAEARGVVLTEENMELARKYKAGTLTSAEFEAAVAKNLSELKAIKAELHEAGLTPVEALLTGSLGGVLGRTALHGAVRVLPTVASAIPGLQWLNFLTPLLSFLLQSESKKKPVPTPAT